MYSGLETQRPGAELAYCLSLQRHIVRTQKGRALSRPKVYLLPASPPIVKGLASVSLLSPARTSRHQGSARHGTLAPLTQLTQLVPSLQQTNGLIQYIRSATQLATAPQVTPY